VRDEVPYNGTVGENPVHDFELEADLEVVGGAGSVALGITDGADDLVVELPVGGPLHGATLSGKPASSLHRTLTGIWPTVPGEALEETIHRSAPEFALQPGPRHRVCLAFVDRRLTLTIDGVYPFAAVDRPVVERRGEVERPVRLGAAGVTVRWHNVRLYRDIHYTAAGPHAIAAPVRLGAGEYFVLGDNSPNSQDNRFWTGADGRLAPVKAEHLIGAPFLVHWPSRVAHGDGPGSGDGQEADSPQAGTPCLDWGRIRWLR
jgi:signal peptidase I